MTREEKISLTADKYCLDEYTRLGFVAGAEWADAHPRWISVEDELPPARDSYDCLSNQVLATDGVDICLSTYNHDEDTKAWFTYDLWPFVNVTHWMPLPSVEHLKEKGGEK